MLAIRPCSEWVYPGRARWWMRKALTRPATRRPANAKTSGGIAAPSANETVSTTVPTPISPVAPATVMAASMGPGHGTYSSPSARMAGAATAACASTATTSRCLRPIEHCGRRTSTVRRADMRLVPGTN